MKKLFFAAVLLLAPFGAFADDDDDDEDGTSAPLIKMSTSNVGHDKAHMEESFLLFKANYKTITGKDGEPGPYDYYSGLKIAFQISEADVLKKNKAACESKNPRSGWYFVSTMGVVFTPNKGIPAQELFKEFPIAIVAQNLDSKGQVKTGCTVRVAKNIEMTGYVRFDGFDQGQGEYHVTVDAFYGDGKRPNLLSRGLSIVASIVTAFKNAGTIGTIANVGLAVAKDVEELRKLNNEGNAKEEARVTTGRKKDTYDDVPGGTRISFTFPRALTPRSQDMSNPDNVNLRYVAAYARYSASIIIDYYRNGKTIDAMKVLTNRVVGGMHYCVVGVSGCPGLESFLQAVSKEAKVPQISGAYSTAASGPELPKVTERWIELHEKCKFVRNLAAQLSLATIDSLLVRWAYMANSGFVTRKGDEFLFTGADHPDYKRGVEATKIDNLTDMCWTKGDARDLRAVEQVMGVTFVTS